MQSFTLFVAHLPSKRNLGLPNAPDNILFPALMHQSFVTTAPPPPPLWERVGDSLAKVQGNYFYSAGEMTGFLHRILTPGKFSIAKGRAKSKVLTSSSPPGGGAYSRALKAEKS